MVFRLRDGLSSRRKKLCNFTHAQSHHRQDLQLGSRNMWTSRHALPMARLPFFVPNSPLPARATARSPLLCGLAMAPNPPPRRSQPLRRLITVTSVRRRMHLRAVKIRNRLPYVGRKVATAWMWQLRWFARRARLSPLSETPRWGYTQICLGFPSRGMSTAFCFAKSGSGSLQLSTECRSQVHAINSVHS